MSEMQEINIVEVKSENLIDINAIQIDKIDSIEKKMESFINQTDGTPFTHLNEGYVVKVHFGRTGYTATDAFKHYLRQMAELKY